MVKYSRTSKYEELRNRLQNDAEADINNKDLSSYEQRLHRINASNFEKPENQVPAEDRDPIHARRQQVLEAKQAAPVETINVEPEAPTTDPRTNFLHGNENYTTAFNNEYLDEYIKEVKKYNMDHGNSSTMSTDLNILRALKNGDEVVKKPYPDEASPKYTNTDTADIPFFGKNNDDLHRDFVMDDENRPPLSDTRSMTKEDIAAEVQNLIRGASFDTNTLNTPAVSAKQDTSSIENTKSTNQYPYYPSYDADRTARQQLLNETTQMRAQLDDYEDNLTEVSDKMRHTNQVLNIVLIVLIAALVLVLCVVIYWVLSSRGIL